MNTTRSIFRTYFDPATQSVRDQGESLRVSWFVSRGRLETPHGARTVWRPPAGLAAGEPVHLSVVLRDDRGGASAEHRTLSFR